MKNLKSSVNKLSKTVTQIIHFIGGIKRTYHGILSESINVFKRTEEEARIKAEKLFLKYARENRAKCGACERYIERWDEGNWNGVIYDHGFKQVGFRAGTCVGARHQCWEKSTDGKVAYINEL